MSCRKTATSNQNILESLWNQRAKRNAHAAAIRQILPFGVCAGVMFFDRSSAQSDLVIEPFRTKHILASESVFAMNAPGFAHTDLSSKSRQFRIGVTGNALLQKAQILERLPSAFNFSATEEFRIAGITNLAVIFRETLHASHIRSQDSRNRSGMVAPLPAWQIKFSRFRSSGHSRMKLLLGNGFS